ncbi:MAG: hypothetical protein WKF95_04150 [Rubrobacter sp.]
MASRWVRWAGIAALGAYSVALIAVEIKISQNFARHFFTDITGPVRFYAVNTTLSVFLLWSTALVFAGCFICTRDNGQHRRERAFYLSQVLMFGFLGFDDRFLLHEALGAKVAFSDALILFGVGALELGLLITLGGLAGAHRGRDRRYLYLAALFFALMVAIDGLLPREMVPRLSLEDLSKTWAGALLFMFACKIFYDRVEDLKQETHPEQK